MPTLERPGFRLYYEWKANAGKPTLVLVHSLGTSTALWDPQVAEFENHFSVLRYDARGHGRSGSPAGPYTMDDLGGDAVALLDELGIERANVCGLSIGGMVVQWLGIRAANRVERLVIANSAARIATADLWAERMQAVAAHGLAPIAPGAVERWYTAGFRERAPEAVAHTTGMLLASDVEGYIASCAALRDADLRSEVGRIGAPTLVAWGRYDPLTTPADAAFLQKRIAGARGLELNAAHIGNVEAADEFNAGVLAFLGERG